MCVAAFIPGNWIIRYQTIYPPGICNMLSTSMHASVSLQAVQQDDDGGDLVNRLWSCS